MSASGNREKTEVRQMPAGRLFVKGQSGNPSGRPKGDVGALARTHTAEAIDALVDALHNPKERVPAAVALLDRGWGKPTQMIAPSEELQSMIAPVLVLQPVRAIDVDAEDRPLVPLEHEVEDDGPPIVDSETFT